MDFRELRQMGNDRENASWKPDPVPLLPGEQVKIPGTENTLIINLRRQIPPFIDKASFEREIRPYLYEHESILINSYFKPAVGKSGYYAFKSVISGFSKTYLAGKMDSGGIGEDDHQFIRDMYEENPEGSFVCRKDLTELEEIRLLKIFAEQTLFVNDNEKTRISSILDRFEIAGRRDAYFANLYVNPAHPHYIAHPDDRVPVSLCVEALRSFAMACSQVYGKASPEDFQVLFKSFGNEFNGFTELKNPVKFCAEVQGKKTNPSGQWTYCELKIEIIQDNEVTSRIKFEGTGVSTPRFERSRQMQTDRMSQFRYSPRRDSQYSFYLRNPLEDRYMVADLVNISLGGFMVSMPRECRNAFENNIPYGFYLFVNSHTFIQGRGELTWKEERGNQVVYGFRIVEIPEDDLAGLKRVLEKDFSIVTKRGIF
jgi:hypothetical protein